MDVQLGEVKQGGLADMLLIKRDPTQDVKLFQNRASLQVIMQGSQFHKNARLH